MRVYFSECDSKKPALRLLSAGVFIVLFSSGLFFVPIAELAARYVFGIVCGIGFVYGCVVIISAIFHIRTSSVLFLEVTDVFVRWVDLAVLFKIKENKVSLNDVVFIGVPRGGDCVGDSICLRLGGDIRLPMYLINDKVAFTNALKMVAPHIVFSDAWEASLSEHR